ncbi:MAG: nucleotidyltransferase domain-containing protein [Saprospirales bacterium]|nr:nucleotidyltransferase domain-containing protein [Saprospirales bacterium]MBK8920500.1 nucleotidyltransferase domain-containing protein [Saprospirales bacterium]
MALPFIVTSRIPGIAALCEKHGVSALFLFGSALTEHFRPDSDLDFLVTFSQVSPAEYADNFFDFRDELSALFQRKIDLVESQTLNNPYFKKIVERTKFPVYARRQSTQVAS